MTKLMLQFNQSSATWNRILKIPALLSLLMAALLVIDLSMAVWIRVPSGWLGSIMGVVGTASSFLAADIAAHYANKAMIKERLWVLGSRSFSSWEELAKFIEKSPGWKLEQWVRNDGMDWNSDASPNEDKA